VGCFWVRQQTEIAAKCRHLSAEDLAQTCRVELVGAFDRYDPTRQPDLIAYLKLQMFNACRAHIRRNYHKADAPHNTMGFDDALYDPSEEGCIDPQRQLEIAEIRRAIGRLKPAYQRVLCMHFFDGHSFTEIATLLHGEEGRNKTTIMRMYNRAVNTLRAELEGWG
jgi:RNA polymerase sigma factor (sigma-70 family)